MRTDFEDALGDKIDTMNFFPPFRDEGMESLVRLGYLKAVNEIAKWMVDRKIEEMKESKDASI